MTDQPSTILLVKPIRSRNLHPAQLARTVLTTLTATLVLMISWLVPLTSAVLADDETWSAPRTVFIEETGHSLDQVFLDVWREGGREMSYGFPITPEITLDNGHIVQYFQYARFEYWPEGDANGQQFHLGKIGEELQPISLQRSVATWTSTGDPAQTARAEQNLALATAWLPVDAPVIAGNTRYVDATEHTVRGAFLDFWERTGEDGYLGNPLTEEYELAGSTYQVFEHGQLEMTLGGEAQMVPVGQILADKYGLDQSPVAQGDLPIYDEGLFIPPPEPSPILIAGDAGPGAIPGTSKSIVVSISQQRMWAYEGETVVLSSYVSTGKPGFDTPMGRFSISKKVPMQDMEGLIGGEYYNVADVPDVMYFTTVGHAFHGTYWHNNFGTVMSHGCVNLPTDIAAILYDWTPMGTPVLILA